MKKFLSALIALMLVCSASLLVACGDDDDSSTTYYRLSIQSNCADGYDFDISNSTPVGNDGSYKFASSINCSVSITVKEGYNAQSLQVTLNGSAIQPTANGNNLYTIDCGYLSSDSTLIINGITRNVLDVSLPAIADYPIGVTNMEITEILRKDAANPVEYDDNDILFGDSVCIEVTTSEDYSLFDMGTSSGMIFGLSNTLKDDINAYFPAEMNGYNTIFHFYILDIKEDMELDFNITDSQVFSKYFGISAASYSGYRIYGYDVPNHTKDVMYLSGAFRSGLSVNFVLETDSYLDVSNISFLFNDAPITVYPHTDETNGQEYYSFVASSEGELEVKGLTVNEEYHTPVVHVDVSELDEQIDIVNIRSTSLYKDDYGCYVYASDNQNIGDNYTVFDKLNAVTQLSYYIGELAGSPTVPSYSATPDVTLQSDANSGKYVYKRLSDGNTSREYLRIINIASVASGSDEVWIINYSTISETNESGTITLNTDSITTDVVTSKDLYIKLVAETDYKKTAFTFNKVRITESGSYTNLGALQSDTKVTFAYSVANRTLTISSQTYGFDVSIVGIDKVGDDYQVDYLDTVTIHFTPAISYSSFNIGVYDPDAEYVDPTITFYADVDNWNRDIKQNNKYTTTQQVSSSRVYFDIRCAY